MGATDFYKGLRNFGVGQRTGIDLENEVPGWLKQPGDVYWSDSDLATNSFGQGVTVTALQMLAFTNAIANKGQIRTSLGNQPNGTSSGAVRHGRRPVCPPPVDRPGRVRATPGLLVLLIARARGAA
jgi:hypothetical protein